MGISDFIKGIEADAHALSVVPLKGLEQDQLKNLGELAGELGIATAGAAWLARRLISER